MKNNIPLPREKFFSANSLFIPLIFTAYGFTSLESDGLQRINLSTKAEILEDHPRFSTKADDYLMFAPAATAFVLEATGVKGEHNLKDKLIIYGAGLVMMTTAVSFLKKVTHQLRPDGSNYHSFPSGHTATAFLSAEFLNREYGFRSPFYSIAGYATAASTGLLRIYNNKHWLADVVIGAGIGILSTRFIYWIFDKIKNRKKPRAALSY